MGTPQQTADEEKQTKKMELAMEMTTNKCHMPKF